MTKSKTDSRLELMPKERGSDPPLNQPGRISNAQQPYELSLPRGIWRVAMSFLVTANLIVGSVLLWRKIPITPDRFQRACIEASNGKYSCQQSTWYLGVSAYVCGILMWIAEQMATWKGLTSFLNRVKDVSRVPKWWIRIVYFAMKASGIVPIFILSLLVLCAKDPEREFYVRLCCQLSFVGLAAQAFMFLSLYAREREPSRLWRVANFCTCGLLKLLSFVYGLLFLLIGVAVVLVIVACDFVFVKAETVEQWFSVTAIATHVAQAVL